MTTKRTSDWHGCPIRYGSAVFGDTWSLLILRDLMFKGARYYGDFLKAGEEISTNILASRLTRLEGDGIIQKKSDPEHGSRFIYSLTDKGLSMVPIMMEIIDWAETWDAQTEVPKEFIDELRADRNQMAKRIVSDLKE